MLIVAPAAASADSDSDTAKAFVATVRSGGDVQAVHPNAVSDREAASLRRLAGCDPTNFMKQKAGRYTVVWVCRGGGALGMGMNLSDGKLVRVETFEVVSRPNRGS
jgi:hypothetical protein